MDHEEEIHQLHRRQARTKFVVIVIVGFLALLTYLLITVSKEIAEGESMDLRSRASEFYGGTQSSIGEEGQGSQGSGGTMQSGNSQTDGSGSQSQDSCYNMGGSSSSFFGPQYCRGLTFSCKGGLKDGMTEEELRRRIEEALKNRFNYGGTCSVAGGVVSCTDQQKSCAGFGGVVGPILKEFCKCATAGGSNPGSGSQNPPATATLTPVPPCVPTRAEFYRRGSCSMFEKCTAPFDPFIVSCKDASGRTCRTGQPADQSCTGCESSEP
jgi:hypothetical protein